MEQNILLNKKVLVAEDNSINRAVVKHVLTALGGSCEMADDGRKAVEMMRSSKFDLVLMDIQMPLMDGYEATRFIRNQLQDSTPVIAMTAFALKGEEEKCKEAGMNGYVAKPFTIESLASSIAHILANAPIVETNPYLLCKEGVCVDVSMLYEVASNDETYIQLMAHTFLENMPSTLQKIEEAFQQSDYENLYRSAHYAKSSLSIIKIDEMLDWVQKIEQSAKHKINLDALPDLIAKVNHRFAIAADLLSSKFQPAVIST